MSAHTPGPWTAIDGKGQYSYEVVGKTPRGKNVVIARVGGGPLTRGGNARLLAAAPDLLAACQEFVRKVESGEARSKRSYAQMVSAIAKTQP